MEKTLKTLTFILENNKEEIDINANDISYIRLEDFEKRVAWINPGKVGNYSNYMIANKVVMMIKSSANLTKNKFERLNEFDDIVQLRLEFTDKTQEYFAVNWGNREPIGKENCHQKTKIDKDGNLYLVIERGKNIYSYFDFLLLDE